MGTDHASCRNVNENLDMLIPLSNQCLEAFLLDVFQPDFTCYHRTRIEFPCYTVERVSKAVVKLETAL